ncbi:MAG: TusE/DsrC/DsvC family sulfur relay protein [Nitrososphaeria archaeon]|nr:TusE/DsrC/DsvC family sulfur relay protein [Nitrososphaeria archaeon]NIN53425.1 TusE/DsrC/DsvC family sulfur relay protein [Nitrososphaeria archaeon]NIQ33940.1 TusE/DsrC/DsvC family sulfur relay protein [Nitrososphaeria archaeon]
MVTEPELDEDGFIEDVDKWSEEAARFIAKEQFGIELEESHWNVIRFFRGYYEKWGTLPMIKTVRKETELSTEQLDQLFQRGESSTRGIICKISGLPKLLCLSAGC